MSRHGKWMICRVCEGEGSTVNPSIDCNGLTRDDFEADPDFAEDYMNGTYDIECRACGGTGKMKKEREEELRRNAEDRRMAAMEDGNWEAYSGAGDWRWG